MAPESNLKLFKGLLPQTHFTLEPLRLDAQVPTQGEHLSTGLSTPVDNLESDLKLTLNGIGRRESLLPKEESKIASPVFQFG